MSGSAVVLGLANGSLEALRAEAVTPIFPFGMTVGASVA